MATIPSTHQQSIEASPVPTVASTRAGVPVWAFAFALLLFAVLLFVLLDARRRDRAAPAVRVRQAEMAIAAPMPTLYIPPEPVPAAPPMSAMLPAVTVTPAPTPSPSPTPVARTIVAPIVEQQSQPQQATQPQRVERPRRVTTEPSLVIDTTTTSTQTDGQPAQAGQKDSSSTSQSGTSVAGARAGAGVLANRATTVPQGTIVAAVLETALDSTRPGLARAIVSRDVRGFDGTKVLIPRGSRLIGEYDAETKSGQNRMLVNWIRLIRPDGATIAIGSPAADTLGRAGIRASVNTHFFERFAGAILQSSLDIGVNLASRSVSAPVVLAYPGGMTGGAQVSAPRDVQPTLKVKPATSISIFVARDLDFTGVENR